MNENINYDNIPVHYCKHCLSLKIIDGGFVDYCDDCGSTDTDEANIYDWQEMYRKRFNKDFSNYKK